MPANFAKSANMFFGDNAAYIEEMRARHAAGDADLPESWRRFFAGEPPANEADHQALVAAIAERARNRAAPAAPAPAAPAPAGGGADAGKQCAVSNLINAFRLLGARDAAINPLAYETPPAPALQLQTHGLSPADEGREFVTDIPQMPRAKLRDILAHLRAAYCGTLAPEFMHVTDPAQRQWLFERFESPRPPLPAALRRRMLERAIAAETLEQYLHRRYVGQKRFSLEGGDSLIPFLDALLLAAAEAGVKETVVGMAHRGRLNVLVNILGKRPADLFLEFEGKHDDAGGSGDVKYHMGFSGSWRGKGGKEDMHLALAFNPSHLEIVNPVVEGSVRARQDRRDGKARELVLPVLVHGDAAFAGQGVVMETLNLSQASGYKTGGTVHIIVNNQIGFTTSSPSDARSTFFCSDIAKMAEIPIVHVNADDIDSVARAARLALEFRQTFGVDIVVDMVCFRRHGHNEQDEPLMTQPLMYQKIAKHPGSPAVYARLLAEQNVVSASEAQALRDACRKKLQAGEPTHPNAVPAKKSDFVDWGVYQKGLKNWDWRPQKPAPLARVKKLALEISQAPANFTPHANLKRLIAQRREMAEGKRPLDWGMAENLSYAMLLTRGHSVRLSGQDCGRGTFSHRHAVWHDQKREKRAGGSHLPLRNLQDAKGEFLVIDSILSEEGVLAFEYGYSTTQPNTLVLWEGQFGDFANGAQVVIDQFIAAGETKWSRYCGLTLLLPHGYEGQGPEHSSARLERYLQLCAEYNMQVCVPSTPAQIYHLLQRQMLRPARYPLVVITPKSLLRHPEATSSLQELAQGRFEPLLEETDANIKPKGVRRLVFCAGKIYYELRAARRAQKINDVAICRLEQLYPFPHSYVEAQIKKYANAGEAVWCQEEPGNQGAWHRLQHYLRRHLRRGQTLKYALRPSAASPAVGYADVHKRQQQEVIEAALKKGRAGKTA